MAEAYPLDTWQDAQISPDANRYEWDLLMYSDKFFLLATYDYYTGVYIGRSIISYGNVAPARTRIVSSAADGAYIVALDPPDGTNQQLSLFPIIYHERPQGRIATINEDTSTHVYRNRSNLGWTQDLNIAGTYGWYDAFRLTFAYNGCLYMPNATSGRWQAYNLSNLQRNTARDIGLPRFDSTATQLLGLQGVQSAVALGDNWVVTSETDKILEAIVPQDFLREKGITVWGRTSGALSARTSWFKVWKNTISYGEWSSSLAPAPDRGLVFVSMSYFGGFDANNRNFTFENYFLRAGQVFDGYPDQGNATVLDSPRYTYESHGVVDRTEGSRIVTKCKVKLVSIRNVRKIVTAGGGGAVSRSLGGDNLWVFHAKGLSTLDLFHPRNHPLTLRVTVPGQTHETVFRVASYERRTGAPGKAGQWLILGTEVFL